MNDASTKNRFFAKLSTFYTSKWLIWGIIGFGVICRIAQYLANRSLWLDEALFAMNIIDRPFSELAKPLEYTAAPLGFLFAEKGILTLLGNSEYALRFLSLLGGIASIFLFYLIAKNFVSSKILPIALLLFAFSDRLIYYSSEAKQYSTDVMFALLLYAIAIYVENKGLNLFSIVLFSLAGAISVWFSHVSPLVLTATGLVLGINYLLKHQYSMAISIGVMCFIWFSSFVISYFIALADLSRTQFFISFWSEADVFMPFPPTSKLDLYWFWKTIYRHVRDYTGYGDMGYLVVLSAPAALALIIGLISLYSRRRKAFWLIIIPPIMLLILSGLKKYPVSTRHTLFAAPLVLILIGEGIDWIRNKTIRKPFLLTVFICLILAHPVFKAGYHLLLPRTCGQTRLTVEYVEKNKRPGEVVFIPQSLPESLKYISKYYMLRYGWVGKDYVEDDGSDLAMQVNKLQNGSAGKIWFLFLTFAGEDTEKMDETLRYLVLCNSKL